MTDHDKKPDAMEDDDDIIELTQVVEINSLNSRPKDISPDDFPEEEMFGRRGDAYPEEPDFDELPEPAALEGFDTHEEDISSSDKASVNAPGGFDMPQPEMASPDEDVSDLGMLVSEITGGSRPSAPEAASAPVPGMEHLSADRLDKAVEKAVEKLFSEKIEARIMALFETVVQKEIEKIATLIEEKAKSD